MGDPWKPKMLSRVSARLSQQTRLLSTEAARPMTRFVQYPFDKTKMVEVRDWVNTSGLPAKLRATEGIDNVEINFCPGQGWLGVRFLFTDLEDMKNYLGAPALEGLKAEVTSAAHYDASREPQEFKGFFLKEA